MLRLLLVLVILKCASCQFLPENPCPDIFAYREGRGFYYGEISIPYDGSKFLSLAVNVSMKGLYQNLKLKLDLLTPTEEILSASFLRYRVNFPNINSIPRITQIAFNDRVLCRGPSEPVTMSGVTNLWANIVFKINQFTYTVPSSPIVPSNLYPTDNQNSVINSNYPAVPSNENIPNPSINIDVRSSTTPPITTSTEDSCGITNDIQTLVVNGEKTKDNEYPWLVALFQNIQFSYDFRCTANLVTNRHVITAAHCVRYYTSALIEKEDILLVIGRSDITRWASTDALIRTALDVIPHPNYTQDSGHCDVVVIKMNEEVVFKPTVRPICLWTGDTNLRSITGSQGVVAGWGKSQNAGQVVTMLRKVAMPVVSDETCLRSHTAFKNLTSEMTFCAGNRDGSGPCNGDSGAGFMIRRNGKWYLRGVVSTAIRNQDFSCDLNEYIVFSDLAKLNSWIKSVLK